MRSLSPIISLPFSPLLLPFFCSSTPFVLCLTGCLDSNTGSGNGRFKHGEERGIQGFRAILAAMPEIHRAIPGLFSSSIDLLLLPCFVLTSHACNITSARNRVEKSFLTRFDHGERPASWRRRFRGSSKQHRVKSRTHLSETDWKGQGGKGHCEGMEASLG